MSIDVDEKWPFVFSDLLAKGNPKANTAICTLWSKKETIIKGVPQEIYAIAGNMYYNEGISYLLRAVLSNPNIRYIILCGADITKSGENLVKLVENGVENHKIAGTNVEIEKEIPPEAIELFRRSVQVIDMRGVTDPTKIKDKINSLGKKEPFGQPRIFPTKPPAKTDTLTSEKTGFIVRERTIAEAWYNILNLVMRFGIIKKSQHSSDQRELVNLVAIVEEEDPERPKIEKWMWFTEEDVKNYYPQIMTGNVPAGTEYTYGNRLRSYDVGKNQIDYIISDLKETKYSRRAIAVTWQHDRDMGSRNPPCWVVLQALVQEEPTPSASKHTGRVYLTCYLRSNDMYAAWPLNAFGLRKIQKEIASALGLQTGPLTTISCSAHIYEHDWKKAQEILEKHSVPKRWQSDPRGNFVIRLDREKKEILVDYYTGDMKKVETFSFKLNPNGKTNIDIYNRLVSSGLISQTGHAADIGGELAKAELALRYGLKYVQDDPLDIHEKT